MDNGLVSAQNSRIVIVDILRGFAIAAILLIHSSNHFLYGVFPVNETNWLQELNEAVKTGLYFVLEGKAYAIFAMLFGFSYALQYENQRLRGGDLCYRMVWRLVILIFWGVLNAAFFAGGDPLVFYAISMFFVIPLRKLSNRWLLVIATFLSLQPLEVIDYIYPSFLGESYVGYYGRLFDYVAQDNFFVMAAANVTIGLKGCLLWAIETGRFTQTLALFLFGMVAYRSGVVMFDSGRLKGSIVVIIPIAIACYILRDICLYGWFAMIYNLMFAALMVVTLILFYRSTKTNSIWMWFGYLGRMSLTNFIAQSVIFSFLYYPWGLNLAPKLGVVISVLLSVVVIVLQMGFSRLWLSYHKRGLLEQMWHDLTWIGNRNKLKR